MEEDIVNALQNLGYSGPVKSRADLDAVLDDVGLVELSRLVHFLSGRLQTLCHLDELVHPISDSGETVAFFMELALLLREMHCPLNRLIESLNTEKLARRADRLRLLDFLASEGLAAMMIAMDQSDLAAAASSEEAPAGRDLEALLAALGLEQPPQGVAAAQLFDKVGSRVREIRGRTPKAPGRSLLGERRLTADQWRRLGRLYGEFFADYQLRREMLLKRIDVTIQSFTWSPRVGDQPDQLRAAFRHLRCDMRPEPGVRLSDLLAARLDTAVYDDPRTSKLTRTPLQRVLIGAVPDRGGRAAENSPAVAEMPRWQKRQPSAAGGGAGGGHGRVQGGWNQTAARGRGQGRHWRGRK